MTGASGATGHGGTLAYVCVAVSKSPLKAARSASPAARRKVNASGNNMPRGVQLASAADAVRPPPTAARVANGAPGARPNPQGRRRRTILHTAPHYSQRRQARASHVVLKARVSIVSSARGREFRTANGLYRSRPVRAEARPCTICGRCRSKPRVARQPRGPSTALGRGVADSGTSAFAVRTPVSAVWSAGGERGYRTCGYPRRCRRVRSAVRPSAMR